MTDAPAKTIQDVVTDFLASAPTLEEISTYRLPEEFQQRAHDLLEKNRSGGLSENEREEMNEFRRIDHLLTMVKTKARLKLQERR